MLTAGQLPMEPSGGIPTGFRARIHRACGGDIRSCWRPRWRTGIFLPAFLLACLATFLLIPWLGQDFFPAVDTGQIKLHMRGATGMRIEETARLCDLVEASIRRTIPQRDMDGILDNIGLPYSPINLTYSNSAPIGSQDADILVTLREHHQPTANYVDALTECLPREFPEATFAFLPADMVSQILNFGLPAPMDVQIVGPNIDASRQFAENLLNQLRHVPGAADLRIQQAFDQPKFHIQVDRTKAAEGGFTQRDIANNLLVSLSGSLQTTPSYWLNPKNGVSYSLVTQTPQYRMQTLHDVENIPITGPGVQRPEILARVASIIGGITRWASFRTTTSSASWIFTERSEPRPGSHGPGFGAHCERRPKWLPPARGSSCAAKSPP